MRLEPTPAIDRSEPRPVVVGEVLFDVFPDGREVLGGAPFNVAWNLRGLGLDPLVVTRVGSDERGERVLGAMESWGLDRAGVQRDDARPTGVVQVRVEDGEPSYEIVPDQAWDHVDGHGAEAALRDVAPSVLVHGTLAMRSPSTRTAIAWLRTRADAPVLLDVNLRAPWWDPRHLRDALRGARSVKVNESELHAVAALHDGAPDDLRGAATTVRERFGLEALVVTRGAEGALWVGPEGACEQDAPEPGRTVDTVGAGDAFASVVVVGTTRGWAPAVTLRRAAAFASVVCGLRGATTDDPAPYRATTERWARESGAGGTRDG